MEIRLRSTGQVMLEDELRRWAKDNNGPSWDRTTDEVLEALGADVVFEGPQATPQNHYQFSMRQGVEQIEGKWYTKYILGPIFTDNEDATAVEQEAAYIAQKDAAQAESVRSQRAQLLKDSDWTQLDDTPFDNAKKMAWANYRQALRDIPDQAGFPWDIQWPDKP
jgi:Phage tail assembly chaperone protein